MWKVSVTTADMRENDNSCRIEGCYVCVEGFQGVNEHLRRCIWNGELCVKVSY